MRILIALICSITIALSGAYAAEVGMITYVEGRVDVLPGGSGKAVSAKEGAVLSVGDAIRTKSNSKAQVTFSDKSIMRIAQNSKIDIVDYRLDQDNARLGAEVRVERGKARTTISKMKNPAEFRITTPNTVGSVKGSDVYAFFQAGNSGMLVTEGTLSVFNTAHPEAVVKIPAGNAVLVPLQEVPKGPRKYLDMEEKFHDQDTSIPESIGTRKSAAVIRGTIAKFVGTVRMTKKGSTEALPVVLGDIVREGDMIVTGPDGVVEVAFDNGNALYMKPDTTLTIERLVVDAATGEFDNLFHVNKGDVKARVEGLKGKSKFEIKTPTALCGARGTIILVHVAPDGATKSFFEGGNGYTTNLASGETLDVNAGGGAATNASGGVSSLDAPSGDERAGMDDGFDPGGGAGSSSEDGDAGAGGLLDSATGGGTGSWVADHSNEADDAENDLGMDENFVDVPITEADGSILTEEEEQDVQHVTQVGDFFYTTLNTNNEPSLMNLAGGMYDFSVASYGSANYEPIDDNDFTALWQYPDTGEYASIDISGNFDLSDTTHQYLIWTTDNLYSWNPETETYTTSDGGAFYCVIGGTIDTGEYGYIQALVAGLYIDADGNAGVFFGSGFSDTAESFTLDGTDSFWADRCFTSYGEIFLTKPDGSRIYPEDLHLYIKNNGNLTGVGYTDFGSGKYSEVNLKLFDGFGASINTELSPEWGMWASRFAGSHKNITEGGWGIALAGTMTTNNAIDGAVTQYVSIDNWSPSEVTGTCEGAYLSLHDNGTIGVGAIAKGMVFGNYVEVDADQTGTWQAVGCGEWVEVYDNSELVSLQAITSQLASLSDTYSQYISVPITEVTSIAGLSGSGSFAGTAGVLSVSAMDISIYEARPIDAIVAANNGIWAATISGCFTGAGADAWSVTVQNPNMPGTGSVVLSGTQWADNKWRANVSGTVIGDDSISRNITGVATGAYTTDTPVNGVNSGTFQGSGVGTWAADSPVNTSNNMYNQGA